MPLVKRIQEKVGPDKLQVLLLSVDLGYGMPKEEASSMDLKRLRKQQVNWPNVLLPHGWDDTQRRFNIDGYGLTLVGPDGIVRGVNISPEEVEPLIGAQHRPG